MLVGDEDNISEEVRAQIEATKKKIAEMQEKAKAAAARKKLES